MKIAVTGGMAEGKSTVVAMFAELGWSIASADAVAKDVMEWPETTARILSALQLSREPSRNELRRLVAEDDIARRRLNGVVHQAVAERLLKSDAEVIEVPLLFEVCLHSYFDRTVCVTCSPEEQRRRVEERGGDWASMHRLSATQLPTRVKSRLSDVTVRTDADFGSVFSDVEQISRMWR